MKNSTPITFHALGTVQPVHPSYCSHPGTCNEFSPWSAAVHLGPVDTLLLDPVATDAGNWESNAALIQSHLQTIELRDGSKAGTVTLSLHTETGGLELDPEHLRTLADWLQVVANNCEAAVSGDAK